eukprot:scaffold214_cov249-Pinguiococcus_pyrenoidosus.AAC.18
MKILSPAVLWPPLALAALGLGRPWPMPQDGKRQSTSASCASQATRGRASFCHPSTAREKRKERHQNPPPAEEEPRKKNPKLVAWSLLPSAPYRNQSVSR